MAFVDAHIWVSDDKESPSLKTYFPMSKFKNVDLPAPVLPNTANFNFF